MVTGKILHKSTIINPDIDAFNLCSSLKQCVCRSLATLSEFSALVLEKLQSIDKDSHDMIRLQRNLQFSPLLSDVQRYSDKRFFLDSLVIHALELDLQPITGKLLIVATPVQNRVLQDCGLSLQDAARLLRSYFEGSQVLFRRDDISQDKSEIFNYRLHGRVLVWFRRSHQEMSVQFSNFWQYLENPRNIHALNEMNKNARRSGSAAERRDTAGRGQARQGVAAARQSGRARRRRGGGGGGDAARQQRGGGAAAARRRCGRARR